MYKKSFSLIKFMKVIFYSFVFALGMNIFLIPMNLLSTGMSGIAQLISDYSIFSYSVIYFVINVPGILLGFNKLGFRFTVYTLVSIVSVSFFAGVIPVYSFTDDIIINCIFSGICMGYALGKLLKNGTSSGGTDFYGIYLEQKYGFSFSNINLVINVIIISIAAFLYGMEVAMYTLLSFYIRNLTMNQFFVANNKLTVWIVGPDLTRVSTYINQVIGHGTTIIEGTGGFTQDKKEVILTILTQYEYSILKDAIKDVCPEAFINVNETHKISGNFKPKKRVNN